ncbi:MAG: hypothetical protein OEU44_01220 [Gammaproteobacteria bacterium]|nr:hypothetical protein [Gammaproteobacteria bacterium]
MVPLSKRTEKLVNSVFADDTARNRVRAMLANECGNGVPFCENSSPEDMDRIRFSVIKLSEGDMKKLESAIKLANVDWRDLFMSAGFGYDVDAHNEWYKTTIGKNKE